MIEALKKRRSYYGINRELPISLEEITDKITEVTRLVPDAFDMKSARVYVILNEKHELLWEEVYKAFNENVPRERIDAFKAGVGTVLFFYDESVVKKFQEKFKLYADNIPIWANHANGMLQISIWTLLCELGLGASIQHYNPVIDERIKKLFDIPQEYKLVAQMPFGGIIKPPRVKEEEDISKRVKIIK